MGMTSDDILKGPSSMHISDYGALAQELGVGEPTLRDIVKELSSPGRDPRDEMPRPILRTDVMELKDLKPGMVLKGTVRNVIDFGAFVDIGVHQDGLVHISEMTDRFIKHPLEVVSVGDIVEVKVLGVELEKQRISLTMKLKETAKKEGRDKGGSSPAGGGRKEERTSDGSGRGRRRSQERGAGRADHPGQERGAGRADRSGRQENAGNGKGRGRESGDTAREKRRAGGVSIPNSGIFAGIKL